MTDGRLWQVHGYWLEVRDRGRAYSSLLTVLSKAGPLLLLATLLSVPLWLSMGTDSDVVGALLWASGNDFTWVGNNLAERAAVICVSLLGRNEGGLTLDKEAVNCVVNSVHRCFDTSPTADYLTKITSRNPASKVTPKVQLVVDMVIADSSEWSLPLLPPIAPILCVCDCTIVRLFASAPDRLVCDVWQTSLSSFSTRTPSTTWSPPSSSMRATHAAPRTAPTSCKRLQRTLYKTSPSARSGRRLFVNMPA